MKQLSYLVIMLFLSALLIAPYAANGQSGNTMFRKKKKEVKQFFHNKIKLNSSTDLRTIGKDIKNLFTQHEKNCKIVSIHCGMSVGQIIQSPSVGRAIVLDYIIKNKKVQYYRQPKFKGNKQSPQNVIEQPKKKLITRTIKAVKQLVVQAESVDDAGNTVKGKKVKLSPEETKEIMIEQLVIRNKLKTLVRMYPEERENLQELIEKYQLKDPESVESEPTVMP